MAPPEGRGGGKGNIGIKGGEEKKWRRRRRLAQNIVTEEGNNSVKKQYMLIAIPNSTAHMG